MDEKRIKKLINWVSLSKELAGNSQSIKANKVPLKYEYQVENIITAITTALNEQRTELREAPKTSVKPSSLQEMIERNEAKIQADKLKK